MIKLQFLEIKVLTNISTHMEWDFIHIVFLLKAKKKNMKINYAIELDHRLFFLHSHNHV